jgi:3-isopropylmalate/(R)-2-methylmalate dehydratase large subunit
MGKTAFQKIIDNHLVRTLTDGRMVLKLDWAWGNEITTPNALLDMQERGCDEVFNVKKVKQMIDHVNPAKDSASAIQGKIMREWSVKHGVEFLDVGRNGVCHATIPEKGWILPGQIGVMGDSHTCTHGAFCAFTAGVGTTEFEIGIITGLWVCPPQKVIRVNFNGKLPTNVFAKDLILTLINKIGVKGATNSVLEFGGKVIDQMSMEGRMTITNMAIEAGGTSGMIMADETLLDYAYPAIAGHFKKGATRKELLAGIKKWNSDPDASYAQVVDIDVSNLRPVVTINYTPGEIIKAADAGNRRINQVYIGSCTNGRLEDLRIAASFFRQTRARVADNLRCIIVPATQYIYERALKEGLIETFVKAGCFIGGPSCGACLGMSCGVLAPGEVCVSTTNRNFHGRMGKDGMVHLASPATAAMTAIQGKITEPPANMAKRALNDAKKPASPKGKAIHLTGWKGKPSKMPDYKKLLAAVAGGEMKDFSGRPFYLKADNIDTDQIIPARYLTEVDKAVFGRHFLEDAPVTDEDRAKVRQCQIVVAGENFGCGSSREHAPWALIGAGVRCVIAPSFARIFENNMFANGLLCITLPKDMIARLFNEQPSQLTINVAAGTVSWPGQPGINFTLSDYQKELIRNGGSVGVMIKIAAELQAEGKL